MRRAAWGAVLSAALLVGCGSAPSPAADDGAVVAEPSTVVVTPPATTLLPPPTLVPPPTITSAGVEDECPAPIDDLSLPPDFDATDISTIEPDIGVVQAYGSEHPDEFVGFRLAHVPQPSWIEVAFTDHVDDHGAALAALVAHPDRLQVVTRPYTQTQLESILATIQQRQLPHIIGVGHGWADVHIDFAPGEEAAADALLAEWGAALSITIGGSVYVPAGCGPQPASPVCADLAGSDPAVAGIVLTVVPTTPTIAAADTGQATLEIDNVGTERFSIDSGIPIVGVLVLPGTDDVIGTFTGGIAGVGGGVDLAPGEHGSIDVIFGASRCDGQPGSAVPPGEYGLRVALTAEGQPDATRAVYLSPEAPITVTA